MSFRIKRKLIDALKKTYGRLDDVFSTSLAPLNGSRVLLGEDRDGMAVDDELTALGMDVALEATVCRVVLEHVNLVGKEIPSKADYMLSSLRDVPCSRDR